MEELEIRVINPREIVPENTVIRWMTKQQVLDIYGDLLDNKERIRLGLELLKDEENI